MMVRTQISLDAADLQAAKHAAAERGISLAEFVRQAIRAQLDQRQPPTGISAIFGIAGPAEPIPVDQMDRLVGESIEAEVERWRLGPDVPKR